MNNKKLHTARSVATALIAAALSGCDALDYAVHGPAVSAGIGAKLLCSAEYVIGNDRAQAFEDM
ncbi:MAG: hypothetical protein V2I45_10245, partial [Halieaceae bacterium]|nr:hypothetical protein [Halieaceae bacterium]